MSVMLKILCLNLSRQFANSLKRALNSPTYFFGNLIQSLQSQKTQFFSCNMRCTNLSFFFKFFFGILGTFIMFKGHFVLFKCLPTYKLKLMTAEKAR